MSNINRTDSQLFIIILCLCIFICVPHVVYAQPTNFTLDFDEGNLRGWTKTGNAFDFQPTLGDNPTARNRGQPSNHQGRYWIGTYERYQGTNRQKPGDIQGDMPTGTLTSAPFTISSGTLSFLIGGGSSFETRVELVFVEGTGEFNERRILNASGNNTETMHRVTWELTPYTGKTGRVRIVDASSEGWGHINADDFRFSSIHEKQSVAGKMERLIARISPERIEVVQGKIAVFKSISTPEGRIEERWTGPGDQQETGRSFKVHTDQLNPGHYGIVLKVRDRYKQSDETKATLEVNPRAVKPVARISLERIEVVQGKIAVFKSISTPEGGIRESWTGPGGQKATGNSFEVYTDQLNPDNYVIMLEVIDRWGQTDGAIATLEVIPKPIVKYNVTIQADPTSIEEGKSVRFEAALHPQIQNIQYRFNFGDQWSDWTVESELQHTYSSPGIYHAFVSVRKEGKIIAESRPVDIEIYRVDLPPGDRARKESIPGTDGRPGIPPWLKWAGIIAGLGAVFGAGYYFSTKVHNQKKEKHLEPSIHIRPYKDIGTQQIESETPVLSGFEICLRPVLDKGKQDIEANGFLIDERREHE